MVSNFDPKVDESVAVEKPIDIYITTTFKIGFTFTCFY